MGKYAGVHPTSRTAATLSRYRTSLRISRSGAARRTAGMVATMRSKSSRNRPYRTNSPRCVSDLSGGLTLRRMMLSAPRSLICCWAWKLTPSPIATSQITAPTPIVIPSTASPERNLCNSRLLAPADSNLNERKADMPGDALRIVLQRNRFGAGSQENSLSLLESVDDLDGSVVFGSQQQLAAPGAVRLFDPRVKGRPLLNDALDGNHQHLATFVNLNP